MRSIILPPSKLAAMETTKTFSLSIFSLIYLISTASAFSPNDHYLISCGSRAAETLDSDHRVFAGDDSSRFLTSTKTITIERSDSAQLSHSQLYVTARAFDYPAHYVFPIVDRGIHHLVRLHFHPVENDYRNRNLREAEFHVVANGFLLLRNYSIPQSGSFPVIKEFVIPIVTHELKITFLPSEKSKFAFVNAIEVISAPQDLIADAAQLIDSGRNERVDGLLRNGFETLYRVNVGGFKVTPFNDSLWRTWVTDDEYLKSTSGSQKIHFGGRIKYRMGGASREVGPDNVYNTARIIKSLDNTIPHDNMTWSFHVQKGYNYMIRLHFCDIASLATGMLYFNVHINGNLACENLDIFDATDWLLASPFYADFVTVVENSTDLVVSVGPSNMSQPRAVDSILNGIEIWKLNNSLGSFDGEVCSETVWRKLAKGQTQALNLLIPLFAAIFLLLGASVFVRRRDGRAIGWSRLPVDVSDADLKGGSEFSCAKA